MRRSTDSRSIVTLRGTLVLMIAPLVGCTLGAPKQAALPPPPNPVVVQPPAPEPQFSVPQTAVTLPSPQPVNEGAIPEPPAIPAPAPEKVEAVAPAPKPPRRAAAGPKPEPEQEAETPAPPAIEDKPKLTLILTEDAQKRLRSNTENRRKEIHDLMGRAKGHATAANNTLLERIKSFEEQTEEAVKRGDYTQADALSERALVLAKELQVD